MKPDQVNEDPSSVGVEASHPVLAAFEVSVANTDWTRIVNARTAGQAKSWYFRELQDPWPNILFTALRCRRIGEPQTSDQFQSNARYRGMPDVRCGQRVKCGDAFGYIVGHNSSANFDVLFDDDSKYSGQRLSVHPHEVELIKNTPERETEDLIDTPIATP